MKLSVIIVTWNSAKLMERCLDYIQASNFSEYYEIIIVDNASTDDTCAVIENHQSFSKINLIKNPDNSGFAGGNNLGFKHATGDYILLLNPDAYLTDPTALATLVDYIDNSGVAAVGPKLLNVDGSHQVGDGGYSLNLLHAFNHAFFLSKFFPKLKGLYLNQKNMNQVLFPDWLCGACMLVRKSVIDKVGGLDERIFMYSEDVEWGQRMRNTGLQLAYLPHTTVTHLQGATQKTDENSVYVSTKWLASKFAILKRDKGRLYQWAFRYIMFKGFILRGLLYTTSSIIKKNPKHKEQAKGMWVYAKFCIRGK